MGHNGIVVDVFDPVLEPCFRPIVSGVDEEFEFAALEPDFEGVAVRDIFPVSGSDVVRTCPVKCLPRVKIVWTLTVGLFSTGDRLQGVGGGTSRYLGKLC